ncbi:MAG: methyltransferase [Bacteroidota bacterium]|nr:MAG: methyltransferase [Bacteroidota bacterium]
MTHETLSVCPICSGNSFTPFLKVKDYTVSKTEFNIVTCGQCSFAFTNPRPTSDTIHAFYKSEEYISHTGGSGRLSDRLYRIARNFTLRWKAQLVNHYAQEKSILDFGCGTGNFLIHMRNKGWNAIGVEPSTAVRNKLVDTGIPVVGHLKETNQIFSTITMWHVLEHVHMLTATLTEIKKRLHASGTIFIAVPNYKSADARHYQKYWAAYDVPRHLWHFDQQTMTRVLQNSGLKIVKIVPMKLDAYYVSLLSEQHKDQKIGSITRYTNALVQAWKSNRAASKTGEYSSLIYIAKHL